MSCCPCLEGAVSGLPEMGVTYIPTGAGVRQFPALITALSFRDERNQWEDVGEES